MQKFEYKILFTSFLFAPYFLVLNTYRWKEHCGPMNDDHLKYRDKLENEKWMRNGMARECIGIVSMGTLILTSTSYI